MKARRKTLFELYADPGVVAGVHRAAAAAYRQKRGPTIKWTHYYGRVQKVEIEKNERGQITGFSTIPAHWWLYAVGVEYMKPLDQLPEYFFDTRREAVAYYKKG